jgi:hypothetical protein
LKKEKTAMPRDHISRKQTPEWRRNYDSVFPSEEALTRERFLEEGLPDETYSEWKARKLKWEQDISIVGVLKR